MKIMPVRNYHPSFTNFSGYNYEDDENNNLLQYDDDDDDFDCSKKPDKSISGNITKAESLIVYLAAAVSCFSALVGVNTCSSKSQSQDLTEKTTNLLKSNDIRKDTVLIKDITGDKQPDLILYKKDGSKVVIDLAKQKVLEETKDLTPVK